MIWGSLHILRTGTLRAVVLAVYHGVYILTSPGEWILPTLFLVRISRILLIHEPGECLVWLMSALSLSDTI